MTVAWSCERLRALVYDVPRVWCVWKSPAGVPLRARCLGWKEKRICRRSMAAQSIDQLPLHPYARQPGGVSAADQQRVAAALAAPAPADAGPPAPLSGGYPRAFAMPPQVTTRVCSSAFQLMTGVPMIAGGARGPGCGLGCSAVWRAGCRTRPASAAETRCPACPSALPSARP